MVSSRFAQHFLLSGQGDGCNDLWKQSVLTIAPAPLCTVAVDSVEHMEQMKKRMASQSNTIYVLQADNTQLASYSNVAARHISQLESFSNAASTQISQLASYSNMAAPCISQLQAQVAQLQAQLAQQTASNEQGTSKASSSGGEDLMDVIGAGSRRV